MFGVSLYGQNTSLNVSLLFVIMLAVSAVVLLILLVWELKRPSKTPFSERTMIVSASVGFFGSILTLATSTLAYSVLLFVGCILIGVSMGFIIVAWGRVCVAQGPAKALTHITAAWAIGLPLNLLIEGLEPLAEGVFLSLFPLLSGMFFILLCRFQEDPTYHLDEPVPQQNERNMHVPKHMFFGVDARYLTCIIIFCASFGLMCGFEVFGPDAALGGSLIDIVGMRGIVALIFFVASLFLPRLNMEFLFGICLSFMAIGLVVMTLGAYVVSIESLSRILVPAGYAAFDILVWTLAAYYVRTTPARAAIIVVCAMLFEQVGIFGGASVSLVFSSFVEAQVESFLLLGLGYLLLLSTLGLMRLNSALWLQLNKVDEVFSEEEHGPERALKQLAETFGLTSRECDICSLFAEGRSMPYIAEKLFLSENTVKTHMKHVYTKCGIHSRQELLDIIEKYRS